MSPGTSRAFVTKLARKAAEYERPVGLCEAPTWARRSRGKAFGRSSRDVPRAPVADGPAAQTQAQAQARFITVDQGPDELAADRVLADQLGSSLVTPPEKEGVQGRDRRPGRRQPAEGDGRARDAVRLRGRRDARAKLDLIATCRSRASSTTTYGAYLVVRRSDFPSQAQGRANARAGDGLRAATKRAGTRPRSSSITTGSAPRATSFRRSTSAARESSPGSPTTRKRTSR